MRWVKLSERFPDDWESKILRTAGTRIRLVCSEWIHINDAFWHSGKRIDLNYDQIEWLDEFEEPSQDILWNELNDIVFAQSGGNRVIPDYVIDIWKEKYTIIRK